MPLARKTLIPLLSGGLAAAALAGASQASIQSLDLAKAGWTFVAFSDDTSVFMRHADDRGPVEARKVWTAYELEMARDRQGFSFRSVKSLGEYDCAKRRTRTLAETFHAEPGLAGKDWTQPDFIPTEWAQPAQGSVGDLRMDFACPKATP